MTSIRAWLLLVGLAAIPVTEPRSRPNVRPFMRSVSRPVIVGVASWYGWRHDGRKMANGQPFRALSLTAASRLLPLGTRIRVTNLKNGRAVVVTITDRGPYTPGRLVDLSLGAAKQLRFVEAGLAPVQIQILPPLAQ
jgi:rare lipoprotein A